MGIFSSRKLSPGDLTLSFGAIAFPVHVWAILNLLLIFPAWLLRLSLWELAGGISYPLVDALIESLILWLVLVLFGFILPRKWFADKFVALTSIWVWLLTAAAVWIQYNFGTILQWGPEQILLGALLVVIILGLFYWLVQRFGKLESFIKKVVQNLSVVTYVYILFDLLAVVVVILRNI